MTRYIHRMRTAALAGLASIAALALSATPASADCGPGNANRAYCTGTVPPSQIAALLNKEIAPTGNAASIASLLHNHGFSEKFKALEAGTAVVDWDQVPPGAHLAKKAKPKPVLVASGHLKFRAAGTAKMRIKLTKAGIALLKHAEHEHAKHHAKHLKLTGKAVFTPVGQRPIVRFKTFTLRP